LDADARDVAHRIFVVRERVPVQRAGAMTLLYPRREAARLGPSLTVTELAGLDVSANQRPLAWHRDASEPHAFHLDVPEGTQTIDVRFQIVADDDRLSADVVAIAWQHLLLYPAGWYARNIAVTPSVQLPTGLTSPLPRTTGRSLWSSCSTHRSSLDVTLRACRSRRTVQAL